MGLTSFRHWLEQVLLQGCSGLVKELRMYVQTPKTSDEEARYLRKIVRFDHTSRSQVLAYFTRPGMAGAVEESAKTLRVPRHRYNRIKCGLKQHKEAHTGEHHLMQSILTALSRRHGPYFLLDRMDSQHQRSLLIHMGQDASDCKEFVFSGTPIERHDEYRYLGFVFHATKSMAYGVEYLVAAAKKAVHAMRRHCISLHLSDPATICKLFDILVLPILSYSCEV
ncbi:TPA: hypothetical protein ACH3X3_000737 [Trebouxia sp. C0006]